MTKKNIDIFSNLIKGIGKSNTDSNTLIKQNITILPELKILIPPLSEDERKQLEENILLEGCRESLIIWDNAGTYVLVDGHNRYDICTTHKIDFRVEVKAFNDLAEVKNWMINNQLGKRNISTLIKSYLRGLQYSQEKVTETFRGNQYTKNSGGQIVHQQENANGQIVHNQKTIEKLAQQHQVSAKTIQRDEKFALGLDILTEEDSTLKNKILNKEIKVPTGFIQKLADAEDDKNVKKILLKEFKNKYLDNQKVKITSVSELEKTKKILITRIKQLSSIEMLKKLLIEIEG